VSHENPKKEALRCAFWSGYEPGRRNPGGTLTPLSPDQLQRAARRLRHEADQLRGRGEVALADRVARAANNFEERAARLP